MKEEEIIKEFEDKFKCINTNAGCDSRGNIPFRNDEGEWEAEPCQYCFEVLFKQKDFILQALQSYKDWLVGEIGKKRGKHKVFECNGTRKYEDWCEDERCPSQDNQRILGRNQALSEIQSLIKPEK